LQLSKGAHLISVIFTFFMVTLAWVFFRADSFYHALAIVQVMLGGSGFEVSTISNLVNVTSLKYSLIVGLSIVWIFPNTQQVTHHFRPALQLPDDIGTTKITWNFNWTWAVVHAMVATLCLLKLTEVSKFIYFQF
jgi:hypothetical protein